MAQYKRDAVEAQIAGDVIKAQIAHKSFRLVAWMDSIPDEQLLIELFGYSAHVTAWVEDQRRRWNSDVRKSRRRHQRQRPPRPPDGLLTASEAAAKLRCSIKTLNGHVDAGDLKYVIVGHGTKRPRKMFTDPDLNQFIAAQTREAPPCPSTASRARHSGTSISSGEVVAFTARPKSPPGGKPKK
jgi:hypothetical protein